MNKLIYFFCLVYCPIFFGACTGGEGKLSSDIEHVTVLMPLVAEDMPAVTRTADEDLIKDVNIYLFGRSNNTVFHAYFQSSTISFRCPPGEYDFFLMANIHADLGAKTQSQLLDYTIPKSISYENLPMSANKILNIVPPKGSTTVTLPPMTVTHNVAKIEYHIASFATGIKLKAVQFCNLPLKTKPFSSSAVSSTSAADYTNGTVYKDFGETLSGRYYLFENLQGTNPSITDQTQKNDTRAPACATHIVLWAESGNKILIYKIFLGENSTSDFNIRRNTQHTYTIVIRGENEVDTRVSSFTLNVNDRFDTESYDGYCVRTSPNSLNINITGENPNSITGVLEQTSGMPFTINGLGCQHYEFTLSNPEGNNNFRIEIPKQLITRANSLITYNVNLKNNYGLNRTFTFSHRFANFVMVLIKGKTGVISGTNTLYKNQSTFGGDFYCLCYEDGFTLHATSSTAEGGMFDGWYSDAACTKLLSKSYTYNYKPITFRNSVYAKFI